MKGNDHPITGQLRIGLQAMDAKRHRGAERRHGVFRQVGRIAAMRKHHRPRVGRRPKKGMQQIDLEGMQRASFVINQA